MTDAAQTTADPHWGQQDRDKKAEAILGTLQLHCGRDLRNGLWLDIGCGSGGIAATLAGRVERMIGVDPEPWERWRDYRLQHPNLDFRVGTYRDLETLLDRDSCDVVICNQVYEHVDDSIALLAAIYDVMHPGGVCYFAGPNLLWPIEPHVFWPFVHWLPRGFAQKLMRALGSRRSAELDANSVDYWRLRRWFREQGFEVCIAIRERALAGRGNGLASRILASLPQTLVHTLAPFSPGFVFALKKSDV